MHHALSYQLLHRHGPSSVQTSVDFRVDDESLLRLLARAGAPSDVVGVIEIGRTDSNLGAAARLVGDAAPDTDEGRVLLYVCGECGDLGCGAIGARVTVGNGQIVWSDFALENGYEASTPIGGVGPFEFDAAEYRAVVAAASAL